MAVENPIDLSGLNILKQGVFNDGSQVIEVDPKDLLNTIEYLHSQDLDHLSTMIGSQENGSLATLYPLSSQRPDAKANAIFLKTVVPVENPVLDSVIKFYPGADVYERELMDLLGIQYKVDQEYERLLLPDDFPNDLYPLRKEFTPKQLIETLNTAGVGSEPPDPLDLSEKSDYSISVGPQHPTHKEPIRFQFFVKGEEIEDVKLRLGFNHRGIEKALEAGDYTKNLYLIERICGICSAAHQLAYAVTAEKIAQVTDEIPDRAQWLRILVAELERIHSHILWYGVLAHDAGYDMMFHISWRDREICMDLLEKFTGNRVNYSIQTLGGVRRDITPELQTEMISKLKHLRKKVVEHKNVMEAEKSFALRLQNVGVLSKSDAIKMNAVGPTARGSGVDFDLRRDVPYIGYKDMPFKVFTEKGGDIYSSMVVRLDETIDSIDLCIYILENLPGGEISIKVRPRLPEGEAHTRVEAPRGEDIHYIASNGGKAPYRHKIRAPTLANITSLLHRFKQMQIADIPVIIRLIDPCIGCMERVTFVDVDTNKVKVLTGQELINRSNLKYKKGKQIQLFR